MILFPAIDIIGGKAVRLKKGDYAERTEYGDPLSVAKNIQGAGATHLHLVDLDGAKDGAMSNYETVKSIAAECGLFIEVGGGIRDYARIEAYLSAGVSRVILGTAAVKNPEFLAGAVARFGADTVSAGVDVKAGFAATDGWLEVTNRDGYALVADLMKLGVTNVIYTDISRDGMLSGTNIEAYRTLNAMPGLQVTASGGITTVDELKTLSDMGIYAAIVGKAMYEGRIDLRQALAVCKN